MVNVQATATTEYFLYQGSSVQYQKQVVVHYPAERYGNSISGTVVTHIGAPEACKTRIIDTADMAVATSVFSAARDGRPLRSSAAFRITVFNL
ncbi:hypothetical protein TNCV_692681 [Trichonephila clavipes]|nr:hypothetical protein TNCV_692681 [Trichonephila clavipes]